MMKLKRTLALLLALCMLFVLPACSKKDDEASSSDDVSASDELPEDENFPAVIGDTHLRKAPDTVISISPSLTAIICDLGYASKLTGVSDYCAEGNTEVDGMLKVGTITAPKLAEIKNTAPDVLVTSSPFSEADLTKLQQMNIDVIVLPRAKTVEELEELYRNVGKVFEGETKGAEVGQGLYDLQMTRLDEIRTQVETATVNKTPVVAYLRLMPLTLATGDTFEGKLLEAAGFANSAADYGQWTYPQDKAVDLMPDVIFYDKAVGADAIKGSQIYNTTPAFKNNKCFEYDMELFERQSVAMFDMLEEMATQAVA